MTDQEAIAKAQKELGMATYFEETSIHAGLQAVHRNRAEWLCRVLQLAKKALYIEESQKQTKTNADRIRAMSDEELANWLCSISTAECCDRSCPARDMCDFGDNGMIKWLKQPAEGE